MFVELTPLLTTRTVLITVAKLDDNTLRVNVIPHGKPGDNPVLSTPLTYTGSPKELDADLGKHLASYFQTHTQTASTLAEAKATMEAAAKGSQEEAKCKGEERKKAIQKPHDEGTSSVVADHASTSSSAPRLFLSPRFPWRTWVRWESFRPPHLNSLKLNRMEVTDGGPNTVPLL